MKPTPIWVCKDGQASCTFCELKDQQQYIPKSTVDELLELVKQAHKILKFQKDLGFFQKNNDPIEVNYSPDWVIENAETFIQNSEKAIAKAEEK